MIEGSCCCGAVAFRLRQEPSMMGTCHCSRCRKVGASTIVFVRREDLEWVRGRENVTLFPPEPPYRYGRCFCGTCGTSLGEILSQEDSFPIAANAIDGALTVRNALHEFVDEKPDWYDICDESERAQGHPVGA